MRYDVCLEMVFPHLPAEERILRIAAAGYQAVEFWFHDSTFDGAGCSTALPKDAAAIRQACARAGVTLTNTVVNSPDGSIGGSPVDAGDLNRYLERLEEVITFSLSLDCRKAITCSGNARPDLTTSQMRSNLENALGRAASLAEKQGFQLLLEPLNTHVDHAGYFLDSSRAATEIVRGVNSPGLRLLYDVYHMQIMEGNLLATIERDLDIIGHFHSAGVPGRGEHYLGELAYPEIVRRIDSWGYKGYFGLEYTPTLEDHQESLRRVGAHLQGES